MMIIFRSQKYIIVLVSCSLQIRMCFGEIPFCDGLFKKILIFTLALKKILYIQMYIVTYQKTYMTRATNSKMQFILVIVSYRETLTDQRI